MCMVGTRRDSDCDQSKIALKRRDHHVSTQLGCEGTSTANISFDDSHCHCVNYARCTPCMASGVAHSLGPAGSMDVGAVSLLAERI